MTDLRKVQSGPSLGRSLELAHTGLDWLEAAQIRMWRLPGLVPYGTHPDYPQFHDQPARFDAELAAFGARLRSLRIRVSEHPGQYTVLASPRADVVERSVRDLVQSDEVFTRMGFDPLDAPLIVHVGGRYNDPDGARSRLLSAIAQLPHDVRARLCLEHDDRLWSAFEVHEICRSAGVRMIFDAHHHICHNPENWPYEDALLAALDTWPALSIPKLHLSSGKMQPTDRAHADHIRGSDWQRLAHALTELGRDADVIIEAKAKDHAVLELAMRIRSGGLMRPPDLVHLPSWP